MLNISNLHYHYESPDGSIPVLSGIDLSIKAGESVALMGPNGAGKTTFARCLNGLVTPTAGEVIVVGLNTREPNHLVEIRRLVGVVFQNPENQIVSTTVEREIAFGLENLGIERTRMHRIVEEMLEKFKLADLRTHAPHLLSGGEMQRLALAAVMAMSPGLIIFDEPTSLLDPANRQMVLALIAELHSSPIQDGRALMSTLLITQNPEEALICDRLLVMNQGRFIWDGKPGEVFTRVDEFKELGLQVPVEYEIRDYMEKAGFGEQALDPEDFQSFCNRC